MMIRLSARFAHSLLSLLAILCFGCGPNGAAKLSYDSLGLTEVTGVVRLDGEPLEGATVSMVPEGSFSGSFGTTDANGKYRLMYTSEKSGVTPGEKIVRVSTADKGAESAPGKERVPSKYNSKSTMKVVVPENSSLEWNIELDSKGKVDAPEVIKEDR